LKLLLLLLLIFVPKIQAKIYYLDAQALDENEYQIKETKKYRFYKEEKIYNYFIEDENDQDFLNKDNKKYFYTTYSEYSKEKPESLKNREIKERTVYIYQRLKKAKYVRLEVFSDDEVLIEYRIRKGRENLKNSAFCKNCSEFYYMNLEDEDYITGVKINILDIDLKHSSDINDIKIDIAFNTNDVKYKITFYEDDNLTNPLYSWEKLSTANLITIDEFEILDAAFIEEFELYTKRNDMMLKDSYQEYSYRDKYIGYYKIIKNYYPGYVENVEGYIKDNDDFIVEKEYLKKARIEIKDSIVITSSVYDLNDYIKSDIPYEIISNIDITKNGEYEVKFLFPNKTITKKVKVDTYNEYIKSLENKLEIKNKELLDTIENKNEIIDRLESNLKTKDEIISKKEIKTYVKKTNILPIILITLGVVLIIFVVYKSFNKLSN
jgi:hypothetical protein